MLVVWNVVVDVVLVIFLRRYFQPQPSPLFLPTNTPHDSAYLEPKAPVETSFGDFFVGAGAGSPRGLGSEHFSYRLQLLSHHAAVERSSDQQAPTAAGSTAAAAAGATTHSKQR